MDIDLNNDPLGKDSDDEPVYLSDVWPSNDEIKQAVGDAVRADMFTKSYADVFTGDERWRGIQVPEDDRYTWPDSTYVRKPTFFEGMPAEPMPVEPIERSSQAKFGVKLLAIEMEAKRPTCWPLAQAPSNRLCRAPSHSSQ